ncbi:MAG: M28 family peptidase [Akkermansiaceae bacterium]
MKLTQLVFLFAFGASFGALSANEFANAEATATRQGMMAIGATSAAINQKDLRRYVTRLASREYEGRGTGDQGERMATAYLASFFKGLDLEPAGDDGSYFQSFGVGSETKLGGKNSMTLKVEELVGVNIAYTPGKHYQPLSFSSPGKMEAGIVFAGFGIETDGYNSFEGLDVEGKWVMVFRGNPSSNGGLRSFGPLVAKANAAKERKAAGIIFVKAGNPTISSELIDPSANVGGRGQILPAMTITDGVAATLLANDKQEELQALFDSYNKGDRVKGFPVSCRIGAEINFKTKPLTGRNVIARLVVGEKPSDEVVVIGGHIDHLGYGNRGGTRARGAEATKMHVGADDNASGVAVIMELAQLYASQRKKGPLDMKRDIVFAAWSGEEMGLFGSRHFVAEATKDNGPLHPRIAAYLNLDMVGRVAENGLTVHGTASSKAWNGLLDSLAKVPNLEVERSASPFLPTDASPFYSGGVPILALFTGIHDDYHTPADTIDKIDFPGLNAVTKYMKAITGAVAKGDKAPDYAEVEQPRRGRRNMPRVRIGLMPSDNQGGGVLITQVVADSPSERAGLKEGDIMVSFAGQKLEGVESLFAELSKAKAGEKYDVKVKRGEKELTLKLIPEAR